MNYLAHSYFAYNDEQIVGQFLQDFIKNKDRFTYSPEIQKGIVLHRAIDTFTDEHPIIHEAKKIFAPYVRLYAGAFVDVAMDYFLANDTSIYSYKEWEQHAQKVYNAFENYKHILPKTMYTMVSQMKKDDWLTNYRHENGIKFSMQNVLRKAQYLENDIPIFDVFLRNLDILKKHYEIFFPELLEEIKIIREQKLNI